MKNVKRLIVLLVFVLLLLPIKVLADENIIFTNEETNYSVIIDDKADLISEEDEARLKDTMIGITKYANVIFLSTDSNPSTAKSYADDYILSRYRNENGVIFLIDMDNRIIWLAATGNTRSIITNGKAESITDNVFRYASSKEYYECANNAFKQVYILLDGGKINEPMKVLSNLLISITSSVVIGYIIISAGTRIKKQVAIKNYTKSFEVSKAEALFIGDHTVYVPPSDSGGSSGGGGAV